MAAEVDDVSGQTVAFYNTPSIGGAVTGTGTLFGEYLDGNSMIIYRYTNTLFCTLEKQKRVKFK